MKSGYAMPLVALLFLLAGCAPAPVSNYRLAPEGAVWAGEYAFTPPGSGWQLLPLAEEDYAFAFHRQESGPFPSQSTFAYSEEPFGYSRDLEERSREFFRRFLWASRVRFAEPDTRTIEVLGNPGLETTVEGVEPVKGHKVLARVIFARRGERVVAFYFTQWRPEDIPFAPAEMAPFDLFVRSFRFLRPSFYETLMADGPAGESHDRGR